MTWRALRDLVRRGRSRKPEPARLSGLIMGVALLGPPEKRELGMSVQRLEVIADDTETGSAIVDRLTLESPSDVIWRDEVAPDPHPGTPPSVDGGTIVVRIRGDAHGQIQVEMPDGHGTVTLTHDTAADQILSVLTRGRLDGEVERPNLHAGAVADDEGSAIVLLGCSGAGKSTMVAHLADLGCSVISDEQVTVFTEHGLVGAFTRPVAIKAGGIPYAPAHLHHLDDRDHTLLVTVRQLGSAHRLLARPHLIALLDRQDQVESTTWEAVTPGKAVETLCANNLDLVRALVPGLEAFATLAASVPVIRLQYRSTREAAVELRRLLEHPPIVAPTAWSVRVETYVDGDDTDPATKLVRATAGVVTVDIGDEAVLFDPRDRTVVRLNTSGAALWRSLPWGDDDIQRNADRPGGPDAMPEAEAEAWAPSGRFLADLIDRGLVVLSPRAPPVTER